MLLSLCSGCFISYHYHSADKMVSCNWKAWVPYAAETICFWLSSTGREQLARHGADAGGKQAEAADSVNHSFTASMLQGLEAVAGGRVRGGGVFPFFYHIEDPFHTISALC